jgi:F-type H+-transporting ATPase subunit delta
MTVQPDVTGTVFEEDSSGVARNYAEALLNIIEKDGSGDEVLDELDAIVSDVLLGHPQFGRLLTTPSIPAHEKDRIVVTTFEGRAHPTVVRFLRVLNQHGRLNVLPSISREARAFWNKRKNRVPVSVRSAVALDEGERAALVERLGRLTGGTPLLSFGVDPSLIGGIVVQVGDHIYDASVRSHLERLRRRLIDGKSQELRSRNLVEI